MPPLNRSALLTGQRQCIWAVLLGAMLMLPLAPAGASGLVLQVHPVFTPEQTGLVFQPLIDYLEEATGERIELHSARDFHRHWLDLRRGQQPDLVLEDAHLIALRMERDGYVPLVRAEEPATFSLMSSVAAAEPGLGDFIGRPVATMPAPSLGHMVLASWYPNPMQQPRIQSSALSWLDAVESVFAMEAEAAVVPHNLVARYVNLIEIATSSEFPHLTIAAAPHVPQQLRSSIQSALLALHDNTEHFGVLHELDTERFVPASADEYLGLERWLNWAYSEF